jgi:hypothetical protein
LGFFKDPIFTSCERWVSVLILVFHTPVVHLFSWVFA